MPRTDRYRVAPARIDAVRRFNRFHTRLVGALNEGLLASPYSLAQVRVLYEIANGDGRSAAEIGRILGLDRGYLSRLLTGLEEQGLIHRQALADNARQRRLILTKAGARIFGELNAASAREVEELLGSLSEERQSELVTAMGTILGILEGSAGQLGSDARDPSSRRIAFRLRAPVPGDMGWIVHRHGTLYWEEYGWDWRFESLVAEIVARFVQNFQPDRERCWVAHREGMNGPEIIGSVFLVRESADVAKLRLLYVEPSARGFGLGRTLVRECIAFARSKGYRTLTLWTNDVLLAARRIYETEGFILTEEEPHHSFGHDLVGQNWTLSL